MATYRNADADCVAMIKELMADNHPELTEAGVRVGARFAYPAVNESTVEPRGPALTHGGYAAAAVVRRISQKDRVAGLPDAIIDIDGEAWKDEWNEDRKRAVLDHELQHLEISRDEEGAVKLDDCNRPKLKLRLHDWQLGGFEAIARRHGDAAIEVEAAKQLADSYGQLLFPWASEVAAV